MIPEENNDQRGRKELSQRRIAAGLNYRDKIIILIIFSKHRDKRLIPIPYIFD